MIFWMQISNNFKKHETKQWKTELQMAYNSESPEGWRTGPHYLHLSCQSHLWEVLPAQSSSMHTGQFVKVAVVLGILSTGDDPATLLTHLYHF